MDTTDEKLDQLMLELRNRRVARPGEMRRKVLILSTPRCGSTMFCDVLNQYGGLGECREWFNFRYLLAYQRVTGVGTIDIVDYFKFVVSRALRGSDTFIANVHIGDYRKLLERNINLLHINFDTIFYLKRKKKLLQAISLAKAALTDQWEADSKSLLNKPIDPPFSLISTSLRSLLHDEEFYEENLKPLVALEFDYETFSSASAPDSFKTLYEALNIETHKASFETSLVRQSNQETSGLAEEFLLYLKGTDKNC